MLACSVEDEAMRKLLIALGVFVAVTVGSSSVVVAGFDEGFAAYKRGD